MISTPDTTYEIQFIGTRLPADTGGASLEIPAEQIGVVLAKSSGPQASYRLTGDELYVRAVVTASAPHPNPSFADQRQQAWTQPVGWEAHVAPSRAGD